MEKKVSLIIGGTGGIGVETARLLLEEGKIVCITGKNIDEANKEVNKLRELGAQFYNLDVLDKKSVENTISSVFEKNNKVDSIVYSISAPIINKRIGDLKWEDFQEHIDTQIKGLLFLTQLILPKINETRVKFVVVLTEYCLAKPPSMVAHYVTAKYGLMGFVKSMAVEINPKKATFNMISPGMVNTKLLSNLPEKLLELTAYHNPMKRIAEPKDVANVISFLLSEKADYLNGVNIPINGGNIFI